MLPDPVSSGIAWFLAWLFGLAALHKLRSTPFYMDLLAGWFPGIAVGAALVRVSAALEGAVMVALLVPQARAAGLLAAAMMLLVYAAAMGLQLAQGQRNMRCGCAGPASDVSISPALLVRNFLCAALALAAIVPGVITSMNISSLSLSLAIALFLVLSYLTSEQMIANAQRISGER